MSDDLRDRLAAALKEVRLRLGPNALVMAQRGEPLMLSGGECDQAADAVLAVVQPELDRLLAFLERGYEQHMRFGVLGDDGTVEMLRCADWCYRCKLEKAGAERDAALATLARVRKYAELMTDSVVVPVRGYGVDLVHMLDCAQEHATIAEQDACPGPAGAGSTQDGAQ